MKLEKFNNLNQKCVVRIDQDCEEFFLSYNGGVYKINEVGYEIIKLLDKKFSVPQIINILSTKYNVVSQDIKEDVIEFVEKLKVLKLCN
ncbi:PqqD family protein [uncultured Dubosiella sp.]|uniref:PqqD family protein n=1 Tax=uncultured Dubosiella sp. TaxID=1937011 RepID=UPI00207DFB7C|nr:PqqD family protein [uncultured Dubosiella sp.]GJM56735.1 hypothetical protein EROP_04280 [Erysipelotrichaceae bacterium OPF54]